MIPDPNIHHLITLKNSNWITISLPVNQLQELTISTKSMSHYNFIFQNTFQLHIVINYVIIITDCYKINGRNALAVYYMKIIMNRLHC